MYIVRDHCTVQCTVRTMYNEPRVESYSAVTVFAVLNTLVVFHNLIVQYTLYKQYSLCCSAYTVSTTTVLYNPVYKCWVVYSSKSNKHSTGRWWIVLINIHFKHKESIWFVLYPYSVRLSDFIWTLLRVQATFSVQFSQHCIPPPSNFLEHPFIGVWLPA